MANLAAALATTTSQNIAEDDILPLGGATPGAEVADATRKFRVALQGGATGFAILSGSVNPDLIDRAARNIAQARDILPTAVAEPILPPLATGHVQEQSFALWPFRTPLLEGHRINRYIHRHRYAPRICEWHIELVGETLAPATSETTERNLAAIAQDQLISRAVCKAAKRGLEQLQTGHTSLAHCLQHGDFWIGNVLLPDRNDEAPFFIIDWAGMNQNGYPFMDMCSMLMSLRCSKRFARHYMTALQTRIGCDRNEILMSILSGLGHLSQNLEHFPPDRFRQMAEDIFRFAQQTSR